MVESWRCRRQRLRQILCIYRPNGTIYEPKSKKSFEKDFNVRISCRTKAQSIPEGLGLKMALGAKLKKKYENFFYLIENKPEFMASIFVCDLKCSYSHACNSDAWFLSSKVRNNEFIMSSNINITRDITHFNGAS